MARIIFTVSCTMDIEPEEKMKILIETEVKATPAAVWYAWITPKDITNWNFAIAEWCCPNAEINLEVRGKFNY